ncbi:16S rRNA (cytosine(1407)-C(5))-methyltransferase RsmF, partial [Vibrio furnissii]
VFGGWLPEQFDAVLIDAPCSGEGTIRKDPDAMKNWSKASVLSIADTQKDLIESAFQALKVGGVLVYSTCTLSREENQ